MKPGFWNVAEEVIRRSDIVLEILDARMPELTRNHRLEGYSKKNGKPLILLINKADLVSRTAITNLKDQYQDFDYVFTTIKNNKWIDSLIGMIRARVRRADIRVAFIGYPNTGKSSLINKLSKGARAKTSSVSGFTKGYQFISGKGDLLLIDTPGVVPFEARDELRLGLVSGISPTKLKDPELVAIELIDIFKQNNPRALEQEYKINPELDAEDFLAEFGKSKNMLRKGGMVDEKRAAIQILIDWHNGKIKL